MNTDSIAHTSTSDARGFDSGIVAPRGQFSFTFQDAGTFTYHCAIHPGIVARQYPVQAKPLTLASPPGTLQARRGGFRAGSYGPSSPSDAYRPPARNPCPAPPTKHPRAFASALSPNRRLLWVLLRWLWPRWREARVLVQPATVDRWYREGVRLCWRRREERPERPCIDSSCRDLIRRMAAENCLWGAPRIHGELLKLGIVVSERTSRAICATARQPVTVLAYILRESPGRPDTYLAGDVRGCARWRHRCRRPVTRSPSHGWLRRPASSGSFPSRMRSLKRWRMKHVTASARNRALGGRPVHDRVQMAAVDARRVTVNQLCLSESPGT